jgi:signal peptidase I
MIRFFAFFWSVLRLNPEAFLEKDGHRRPLTYFLIAAAAFPALYYALWPYDPLSSVYVPYHVRTSSPVLDVVVSAAVWIFLIAALLTLPLLPGALLKGITGLIRFVPLCAYAFASFWLYMLLIAVATLLLIQFNVIADTPVLLRALVVTLFVFYGFVMLFRLFNAVLPFQGSQAAAAVAFFVVSMIAMNVLFFVSIVRFFYIFNISMVPALGNNQTVFASQWKYHHVMQPARGDIIIYTAPRHGDGYRVSRVIGVPGDTIYVNGGFVTLNGRELNYARRPDAQRFHYIDKQGNRFSVRLADEWLPGQFGETVILSAANPQLAPDPGFMLQPYTLKPCEYFVLGDNRPNSDDSRFPEHGPVRCGEIDGIVVGTAFPLFSRHNPTKLDLTREPHDNQPR